MHARLFENQRALSELSLHAKAIGSDTAKFQQCLDSGKYAVKIRKDLADGQKAGVTATPSFFLGVTQRIDQKVKVRRVLKGGQPYTSFKEAIDAILSSQK